MAEVARDVEEQELKSQSSFERGLRAGAEEFGGMVEGAKAAGYAIIGDTEKMQQKLGVAQQQFEIASKIGPEISDTNQIQDLSDVGSYVTGILGKFLPTIAGMAVSGGTAGVAGAAANVAAKTFAKAGVKNAAKKASIAGAFTNNLSIMSGSSFNSVMQNPAVKAGVEAAARGERIQDARNGVRGYAIRIIDGDTYEFQPEDGSDPYAIRIPHINTADVGQEGKEAAAAALAGVLPLNEQIFTTEGRKGKFGRRVAHTYLPGQERSIGEQVMGSGAAAIHPFYPGQEHLYKEFAAGRGAEGALPTLYPRKGAEALTPEEIAEMTARGEAIPEPAESMFGGPLSAREVAFTSILGGTISAVAEIATPLVAISRIGGSAMMKTIKGEVVKELEATGSKAFAKRVAKEGLTHTVIEAGTEGAQTVIERTVAKVVDQNQDIFTEEGLHEIGQAMIAGGIGGGAMGALVGVPRRGARRPDVDADVNRALDEIDAGLKEEAAKPEEGVVVEEVEAEEITIEAPAEVREMQEEEALGAALEEAGVSQDDVFGEGIHVRETDRAFEQAKAELSPEAVGRAMGTEPTSAGRAIQRRMDSLIKLGQPAAIRTLLDRVSFEAKKMFPGNAIQQKEYVVDTAKSYFQNKSQEAERQHGFATEAQFDALQDLNNARTEEADISSRIQEGRELEVEQELELLQSFDAQTFRMEKSAKTRKQAEARNALSTEEKVTQQIEAYRKNPDGAFSRRVAELDKYANKTLAKRIDRLEKRATQAEFNWDKLYDEKNPEKFLENYLTLEMEQEGTFTKSEEGRYIIKPADLAKRAIEGKESSKILRPAEKAEPQDHDIIGVDPEGESVLINLRSLASLIYSKEAGQKLQDLTGDVNSQERIQQVSDQVMAGLNSLSTNHGIWVDLEAITPEQAAGVVVFGKGPTAITLADALAPARTETEYQVEREIYDPASVEVEMGVSERGIEEPAELSPIVRGREGLAAREPEIPRVEKRTTKKGKRTEEEIDTEIEDLRIQYTEAAEAAKAKGLKPVERQRLTRKTKAIAKRGKGLAKELEKVRAREEAISTRIIAEEKAKQAAEKAKDVSGLSRTSGKDSEAKLIYTDAKTEQQTGKAERTVKKPPPEAAAKVDLQRAEHEALTAQTIKELKTHEHEAGQQRLQKLADRVVEKLGLGKKIKVASLEETLQQLLKSKPEKIEGIRSGSVRGLHWVKGGVTHVFIHPHPKLSHLERVEILGHEIGHSVFQYMMKNADAKTIAALEADHSKWWQEHHDGDTLSLARSKRAFALARRKMEEGWTTDLADLSKKDRDYQLKFEEWFADHVARWLETNKRPRGAMQQFFSQAAEYIKKIFPVLKSEGFMPHRRVAGYLNSLWDRKTDYVKAANEDVAAVAQTTEKTAAHKKVEKLVGADGREAALAAKLMTSDNFDENMKGFSWTFHNLLSAKDRGILLKAFSSFSVMRQMEKLTQDAPGVAEKIHTDPEFAVALGYALMRAGKLNIGPKTEGVMFRLWRKIQAILGIVTDSTQAEEVVAAMQNQKTMADLAANPNLSIHRPRQLMDTKLQQNFSIARDVMDATAGYGNKLISQGYANLARSGNPHAKKIATHFHNMYGAKHISETYHKGREAMLGHFTAQAADIITPDMSPDFVREVLSGLQTGKLSSDKKVLKVQNQVKNLMKAVRSYAMKSGVEMGSRGPNYFPWHFNMDKIVQDKEGFQNLIIDNAPPAFYATSVVYDKKTKKRKQVVDQKLAAKYMKEGVPDEVKAAKASAIYDAIIRSDGSGDIDVHHNQALHRPYMGAQEVRTLSFLEDHLDALQPYLNQDLGGTLFAYINQATKRAEYTKRFGSQGEKLEALLDKMKQTGATAAEIAEAKEFIDAQMGVLGADINPKLQKAMSAMIVFQNMRLLSTALFSSIPDVVGIYTRSGDSRVAWDAFNVGLREMKAKLGGDRTKIREMGEAIGTIERHGIHEALGWMYGGTYLSSTAQKINQKFFDVIGLTSWTRVTRMMALGGAKSFIKGHTQNPGKQSKRYMDELGLQDGDIRFDNEGEVAVLGTQEYSGLLLQRDELVEQQRRGADVTGELGRVDAEIDRENRVRAALNRWVDGAILRPTAATRPTWASDPKWMLVFHLQGFMYSFYDTHIKRAFHEGRYENNFKPAVAMMLFVPMMLASETLRDLFQHLGGEDPAKRGWDEWDHTGYAIERSGILGLAERISDADQNLQYGQFPWESSMGPTAEWGFDFMRAISSQSEDSIQNWTIKSLPFQNVTRHWVARAGELTE
jgi:hypothetical protein